MVTQREKKLARALRRAQEQRGINLVKQAKKERRKHG